MMLQVCGRRERATVSEVTARELTAAVERCFCVRPPFQFSDRQGRLLEDDTALSAHAAVGDAVVVRLTEGVLYDLGRRVDQIRHLQWGFLADQLASLRQERSSGDGRGPHDSPPEAALREEQSVRDARDAEPQHGLDVIHELCARERAAREALLAEAEARAEEVQGRLRQAIETCQAAIRKDKEDIQSLLKQEATMREDSDFELRRELIELRCATVGAASTAAEIPDTVRGAARQLEELRRGLEHEAHERQLVGRTIEQLSQESRKHHCDVERLYKLIADGEERRVEDAGRLPSTASDGQDRGGGGVAVAASEVRQLEGALAEYRDLLRSEAAQWSAGRAELERRMELCQSAVARLRGDCKEAMQREVRSRVERERSLRDALDGQSAELRTELHKLDLRPHGELWQSGGMARAPAVGSAYHGMSSAVGLNSTSRMAREISDFGLGRSATPPAQPAVGLLGGTPGVALWPS